MAISVQPVDGLINRLLQQNSRSAPVSEKRLNSQIGPGQDQVSISSREQTRHHDPRPLSGGQKIMPGGKALESHLLNLYKINDSFGA